MVQVIDVSSLKVMFFHFVHVIKRVLERHRFVAADCVGEVKTKWWYVNLLPMYKHLLTNIRLKLC